MKTILPLEKMTRLEKIQVMEEIWQDLTLSSEDFESPAWHEAELRNREERVKEGKEAYIPWEEAKRILRSKA
jgi:putative addiction module component (TIGR02574 family)